jgi:hypothetical protein
MPRKMIVRLFLPAIALLAGSSVTYCFFGIFIPYQLADATMLVEVARLSSNLAAIGAPALVFASAVAGMHSLWRLRRWELGLENICGNCGGMVVERSGRYAQYQHCLNCGRKKRN